MSAPVFSYAQAAKGRTPAPASSPLPAADSHTKDDASSVTTAPDASAKTFSTTSEVSESVKSSQIEADLGSKKSSETGGSDVTVVPAKDEVTAPQDTPTKPSTQSTNDSSARTSNRASEPTDSRKSRKSKKAKSSEKDAENEQAASELEKEKAKKDIANLVESAPPTVNFWKQRAEANAKQPSLSSIMAAAESKTKPALELSTKTSNNAEAAESQRGPTKSSEASRASNDQSVRKARSNRVIEKGEQTPVPSSAVEDVTSWPTPDTIAAEDEKRKTTIEPDSKEKHDDGSKASRTNAKSWQKMDITPSVVFATQIPSRNPAKPRGNGQAGRGAGRGHSGSLSMGTEKATGASNDTLGSKEGVESQGRSREDVRTPFTPSEKSKKFNNADQHTRKQSVPSGSRGSGLGDFVPKNETSKPLNGNESSAKKDGFNGHNNTKSKRGGAHANGRTAHNGQQQPYNANGNGSARVNNHSPPAYGPTYPPQYSGSRGRGRPGPGSNGFKGPTNGMGKMHPQQPQQVGAEYGQYPGYNQVPFPPQPTPQSTHEALLMKALKNQVEYYFSDENLYKDEYLKRQMDAQGFVAFEIIANFKRMLGMTGGDINFMRAAALAEPSVEYVIGDGREYIRRRGDWQQWVLPGQLNPGPTQFAPVTVVNHASPQNAYYQPQPMPYPAQFDPMSSQYAPGYPVPEMHMGYMTRHQFPVNGAQMNHHILNDNSALNVSAPAFSPIQPATNGFMGAYTQPNWEEQTGKQSETQQVPEGQPPSRSDPDDIPNGTAEPVTPTKVNGIHENPEASVV